MEALRSKSSISRFGKRKIKRSGVRTKFMIESLRNEYYSLKEENQRLRNLVAANLPNEEAHAILAGCFVPNAPRAKIDNIDELAEQVAGSSMSEDEEMDGDFGCY